MSEKQFCPKCEYYFSEMFTCPICYGEQKATERIIKLLEQEVDIIYEFAYAIELIKGEN
jgi:RNA polymerase subunit RPABC4/transcription elongation factor Spt4